jgi:hypothetical protein
MIHVDNHDIDVETEIAVVAQEALRRAKAGDKHAIDVVGAFMALSVLFITGARGELSKDEIDAAYFAIDPFMEAAGT